MARLGMDVEQVEQVARQLKTQAQALRSTANQMANLVNTAKSNWDGNDASQFENEWQSTHRPAIDRAADAVDALSDTAMRNVQAQRDTSGSY